MKTRHSHVWIIGLALATASGWATATPWQDSTMHQMGTAVDQAAITAKVKTALLADSRTKAFDAAVDTHGQGVVTLTGTAPTREARTAAGEVAGKVSGVTRVHNRLVVAPHQHS